MQDEELTNVERNRLRLGYKRPQPLFLSMNSIVGFAENISQKYRRVFGVGNVINPYEFVDNLHGTIHYKGAIHKSSLYVHGHSDFDIVLPAFTSTMSDRFTIAHEVGLYLLHSFAGEQKIYSEGNVSSIVRIEANWFAASFLLPRYLIEQCGKRNIDRMVEWFGISSSVANLRVRMLLNE